ncbi:hypothetical protein HAX54_000129, partial [Datura stramonium]|nr:hypothetical protein [Datura stramonium]
LEAPSSWPIAMRGAEVRLAQGQARGALYRHYSRHEAPCLAARWNRKCSKLVKWPSKFKFHFN